MTPGTSTSPERVAAAASRWLWYPDDAAVVRTDDLVVVRWPHYFGAPGPEVLRLGDGQATQELLEEAMRLARGWDADVLTVWVKLDAPADLEDLLLARMGRLHETLDVFALDLTSSLPAIEVPADLEVSWQRDLASTRAALEVSAAAFEEGTLPDDDTLARLAQEAAAAYAGGRGGTALAWLAGRAVGAGGLTVADDGEEPPVARLWGGGVVPDARGRGAYRAVLDARLRYAVDHGCSMALVKGRVETSGPLLRRAGFTAYGQERSYRLAVR